MRVEWDTAKAKVNIRKHGIPLPDAVAALEDDRAISVVEEHDTEERWVTLGMDAFDRVLISARPATPGERKQYEEQE